MPCPGWLARSEPALTHVLATRCLRVGCVDGSRVAVQRRLIERDIETVSAACHRLRLQLRLQRCAPSQLRRGLAEHAFDVALGGLLDQAFGDIAAISVPHPQELTMTGRSVIRQRLRRVSFPDVWWVRANEPLWAAAVRMTLWGRAERER